MSCVDWEAVLAQNELLIADYGTAISDILAGRASSFELDTGQTRQRISKLPIATLRKERAALMNECATIRARINGTGVAQIGSAS